MTTKLKMDSNGFIVGASKQDWKDATKDWHDIKRDVAAIRSMLEHGHQSAVKHNDTQKTAEAIGKAVRRAIAPQMRAVTHGTSSPARRAVHRGAAAPHAGGNPHQARDAHGRFVGAGHSGGGSHGSPQKPPPKQPPHDHDKDDDKDDKDKHKDHHHLKEAAKALTEAGDIAAHVDPAAAAAKEIKEVISPIGRGLAGLFGRSEEKKKLGWFKKIYVKLSEIARGAKDHVAMRTPVSGGGVMGWLGRRILAPLGGFSVGGMLSGAARGIGGFGRSLVGAPLEGFAAARSFLGGRLAPIAAMLDIGNGLSADSLIRNDQSLSASQRRDRRLTNLANTGANLGGHLGGAAAGAAAGAAVGTIIPVIGNAVGAAVGGILGAAFGPGFIRRISEWMSPVIGDAVDFIRDTGKKVGDLYDQVSQVVLAALQALANTRAGKAAVSAYHSAVGATTNAIEWASNTGKKVGGKFNALKQALGFSGGSTLTGMSDAQTRAYAADVAGTESSGRAGAQNSYGYLGQYQFGADALADQGLVDKGKLKAAKAAAARLGPGAWYKGGLHKAFLDDPDNWTIAGGKSAFLMDKAMQDRAFVAYTNTNIAEGMKSGGLPANASPSQIASFAKTAHLKGVAAADAYFSRGLDSYDAYGTSASSYAAQGAAAIGNAPAIAAALGATDIPDARVPTMPNIPDASISRAPVASNSAPSSPSAGPSQEVGQNLRDRTIHHAVSGGIGSGSG